MCRKIVISESDKKRIQDLIFDTMQYDSNSKEHVKVLDAELSKADVLAPEKIPNDVITMNTKVLLSIGEPQDEVVYTLVYPDKADILNNQISILAPIGTAILGFREGDIIDWEVPDGNVQIQVSKILYQPEAAGDFEL